MNKISLPCFTPLKTLQRSSASVPINSVRRLHQSGDTVRFAAQASSTHAPSADMPEDPFHTLALAQAGYADFPSLVDFVTRTQPSKQGHTNRVYLIPGKPDLALRMKKGAPPPTSALLTPVPPFLPGLNISQTLARQGENYELVQRVPGVEGGVPHELSYTVGEAADTIYQAYIQKMASLPQQAYTDLAQLMHALNSVKRTHDYSHARNIMIDDAVGTIGLVDVLDFPRQNNLATMLPPLFDTFYAYRAFLQRGERYTHLDNDYHAILQKAIQAAQETHLPIPEPKGEATKWEEHARPEVLFALCGLKGQWPQVRQWLLAARENGTPNQWETQWQPLCHTASGNG